MTDKTQRERTFHDQIYENQSRERVSKFYSVTASSRRCYQSSVMGDCEGRNVLEYGCGKGCLAIELAQSGASVIGIDISSVVIEQAKLEAEESRAEQSRAEQSRAEQSRAVSVQFLNMDAENTDFADQSFDLICGTGILHHLDLEKTYSELVRILKPDGRAVFLEPLGHNPLINLFRKLTPSLRSMDEHPLKIRDIQLARKYFNGMQARYFHLIILAAVPFREFAVFTILKNFLDAIDEIIFAVLPFLRRYAWTVVIELYGPNHCGS